MTAESKETVNDFGIIGARMVKGVDLVQSTQSISDLLGTPRLRRRSKKKLYASLNME